MALIKCDYCNERVPRARYQLHLKHCVQYRRRLKAGTIEPVSDLSKKKAVSPKVARSMHAKPQLEKKKVVAKKLEPEVKEPVAPKKKASTKKGKSKTK